MDLQGHNNFSHQKKAMSPLIATVLLIAFAVALGAMILNWSSSLGETTGPDCSEIVMEISPYLCYAENMIKMSLRNSGAPVQAVTVRVVDENVKNDIMLKDSELGKGEVIQRDIPFIKTSSTYVGIIPSVEYRGEVVPCPNPVKEIADLPAC